MNDSAHDNTGPGSLERQKPGSKWPCVLQILPALGASGGVERGTVEIAAAITAAGGQALVASEGGPLVHNLGRAGAKHFVLPVASKNPVVMHHNVERIAELIRSENVDLVHVRSRAPAWSAYFACKRAGRPMVTTFHGTYSIGNSLKRRYNAIMTSGERVIAISEFIGGHARRYYGVPVERIRVIHRGVDLQRFDPTHVSAERVIKLAAEWRMPDGVPVVMLPGRLTRWKGQAVLIEAIAKLGRQDLRCVLVGSDQGRVGYRAELEKLIERLGLAGVVRIVDHCDDMPAAYMLTDLVVSASTDPEAFGRVIAEGQAMGRPVIATDHGGAREIIEPGVTGWLTPPGDAVALAERIGTALAMPPDDRDRLAAAAIANIRARFSTARMCERTLAVYDEILAAKAGN
ncbi:MAG: glycosyltransferase family 4 protein [Proteobacteria bacterium]|nr:glycosyltransferase family 4 protein [Pseudomonadota bacterium]